MDYIRTATGGQLLQGDPSSKVESISVDSRTLKSGALFFALPGDNFDGHAYVYQALQKGAAAACVSKPIQLTSHEADQGLIMVSDTLQALQDLARTYRQGFDIPLVGVTGSVGKTTTKDLIALCLQGRFNTLKSSGNHNNDIGLPLSLLELEARHQAAVLEMAMRDRGEIERLARISRPTCAVITNVERVHLETLLTLENIARAKCELLAEMNQDGFALINGDCPELVKESQIYPITRYLFGHHSDCHFQIQKTRVQEEGISIQARLIDREEEFFFPIPASRLASNVLAAVAIAYLLGVEPEISRNQLLNYRSERRRLNIIRQHGGGIIIDDTYNANPISMAAALECGRDLPSCGKWIAVLGDMFELGEDERTGHMEVGRLAAISRVDHLVAVGVRAQFIAQGAREAGLPEQCIHYFSSKSQAISCLKDLLNADDKILFKASRGMELETLICDLDVWDKTVDREDQISIE
ncbi:MAG TPA: UDP-N-acetylmuramoyl-tripeptide--D-alanyl-D-alanine ligase [Syntrophomonadaceae bacterium]|nr:UDP-N-acetylmuramoyl-tripeptide--D-alanyl-D-alanine ligase [Syntrophomonadaceae bacterium]